MLEKIKGTLEFIRENLRDMQGNIMPPSLGTSVFMVEKPKIEKDETKNTRYRSKSAVRRKWHDDFSEG